MPCIPVPPLPIPTLPSGINLVPTLPKVSVAVPNPCCLLPLPNVLRFSVPLPPGTVSVPLAAELKALAKAAKTYLANLQPTCPRE